MQYMCQPIISSSVSLLGAGSKPGQILFLNTESERQFEVLETHAIHRSSCWTFTTNSENIMGIGCSRGFQLFDVNKKKVISKCKTRSDPLAIHWITSQQCWIGQRDGFLHLIDTRTPTRLGEFIPVYSVGMNHGYCSPVSGIQAHGKDVYSLYRSGALAALVPGYGAVEVERGYMGKCKPEKLLEPLGMASGDLGIVVTQPIGKPWILAASQKFQKELNVKRDLPCCSALVCVPQSCFAMNFRRGPNREVPLHCSRSSREDFPIKGDVIIGAHPDGIIAVG
jgi:hypothetical protein